MRCVRQFASNNPLVVAALWYLPSIETLSELSMFPLSFADMMGDKDESGQYRYVAPCPLQGEEADPGHLGGAVLTLEDEFDSEVVDTHMRLLPHSDLFAAYRRSLSGGQQAVLHGGRQRSSCVVTGS